MAGCVLIQLKPSELYILSCDRSVGLRPRPFSTAKNVELLGLNPIRNLHPLQTANCCHNSLLVMDENDVRRGTIKYFFSISYIVFLYHF